MITRKEYRAIRRTCRDNGRYALRWLTADQACVMNTVMYERPIDQLAERADIIARLGWGVHLVKSLIKFPVDFGSAR